MRSLSILMLALAVTVPGWAKNKNPHAVAKHPAPQGFKHQAPPGVKHQAPKAPKHAATKNPKKK